MSAQSSQTNGRPAISGLEIGVLALLVIIGAGGTFVANNVLGSLRLQLETVRRRVETETQRLAAAPVAAPPVEMEAPARNAAAPPAAFAAPVQQMETNLSPVALRTQTLSRLTDLMANGSSLRTGIPSIALMVGGPPSMRDRAGAFVVYPDGSLAANFGELFQLNDAEAAMLENSARSIRERVDRLVLGSAKAERTGENSIRIDVAGSTEGAALRDEFISTFRSVLGEERYSAFAALNGERAGRGGAVGRQVGPAAFFDSFGANASTITIENTNGRYNVRIQSGNGSSSMGGMRDLESVRQRIGAVSNLLPADF